MPFFCDAKLTTTQRKLLPSEGPLKTQILVCQAQIAKIEGLIKKVEDTGVDQPFVWTQAYFIEMRDSARRLLRFAWNNEIEWGWWEYLNYLPVYGKSVLDVPHTRTRE